ncbi:MAG: CPBP family intramembrane metalloprotease, partial [Bacteroidales bacterium]|nr:CPBP family intramembrane metalloprotease [Bacteroidales bacterium]
FFISNSGYYIFNPSYQDIQIKTSKFSKILWLLILTIAFNGVIIITRTVLINKGIIPLLFFKDTGLIASFWFYPLIVLIICPIVEELGFRLFFIPNRINIAISISFLLYFLSCLIFSFSLFEINIYLTIPPVSFLIFLLITLKSSTIKHLNFLIIKYFKIIFYLSAIFYTYVHLTNFWIEKGHIIWLPLIFLPYLMLGLVLGYIRVIFGIKYSIIFHFVYNTFPFLLSLFFLG